MIKPCAFLFIESDKVKCFTVNYEKIKAQHLLLKAGEILLQYQNYGLM